MPTFVIIRERITATHTESSYFVGPDEGFSVMESVAMKFTDNLDQCLRYLNELHSNIESELKDSPSNVRKVTYYPQQLG